MILKACDGKRIITTSPNSIDISLISKILVDHGFDIPCFSKTNKFLDKGGYNLDISETIKIFNCISTDLKNTIIDLANVVQKLI